MSCMAMHVTVTNVRNINEGAKRIFATKFEDEFSRLKFKFFGLLQRLARAKTTKAISDVGLVLRCIILTFPDRSMVLSL